MKRMSSAERKALREMAYSRKCCICGRFISYKDLEYGAVDFEDPTCPSDLEPRDFLPFHRSCQQKQVNP